MNEMRINEIDNEDRAWAAITNVNLDIDEASIKAIDCLKILVKLKNPQLNKIWLPKTEDTEQNLNKISNANFANDTSTQSLKDKAREYLNEIENLKSQL